MTSTDLMIRNTLAVATGATKALEAAKAKQRRISETLTRERVEIANMETNLIFAVDATASRKRFWEETKIIQNEMFAACQGAGTKLVAQLVSFSGLTENKNIFASPWHTSAFTLREHMAGISCEAGGTQIAKVFRHAIQESTKRKVHALIFVGDSCEESADQLLPLAKQLRDKGIRFFLFDDDARSDARQAGTAEVFQATARSAEGVYAPFTMASLDILEDYLKTVAVTATGVKTVFDSVEGDIKTPEGKAFYKRSAFLLENKK